MTEVIINNQFKKGVLELCVLKLVRCKDCYGYELAQRVSKEINISGGTLYPILRRLSKEGNFDTYLKESKGGPPRKYYHITNMGKNRFKTLHNEWKEFMKRVEKILNAKEEIDL